eukprot:gene10986-biopygen13892
MWRSIWCLGGATMTPKTFCGCFLQPAPRRYDQSGKRWLAACRDNQNARILRPHLHDDPIGAEHEWRAADGECNKNSLCTAAQQLPLTPTAPAHLQSSSTHRADRWIMPRRCSGPGLSGLVWSGFNLSGLACSD